MNLDGRVMYVISTAEQGVVSSDTRLYFHQMGSRVFGRYRGGPVSRGYLVGELRGARLTFRYTQVEGSGQIHGGSSVCDLTVQPEGRLRISEHFRWRTRPGFGTNVFDEIVIPS